MVDIKALTVITIGTESVVFFAVFLSVAMQAACYWKISDKCKVKTRSLYTDLGSINNLCRYSSASRFKCTGALTGS